MTQAFFTSISGINANQSQLVVVSDNIANMNTTAFKSSRTTFADVFYTTLSAGSPPTKELGGTNPKQIGAGVKVASIDRDMTAGTVTSTGITTDCNIQGNGFFVVQGSSGEPLYTRAGNFTIDSQGYLTTPNGYRVIGATDVFGTTTSNAPLQIPQMIETETVSNKINLEKKNIGDLNGCTNLNKSGTMTFIAKFDKAAPDNVKEFTVTLEETDDTLAKITKKIHDTLISTGTGITDADLTIACSSDTYDADGNLIPGTDGKFRMDIKEGNTAKLVGFEFKGGSSTFFSATELKEEAAGSGRYSTKVLDYKQNITSPDSVQTAKKYSSVSITENGILEITYSNGDKLSVYEDSVGNNQYKYTTSEGIIIKGNNSETSDVQMSPGVLAQPNLQIQLAQFMNPNGLQAIGSNLFQVGPNAGTTYYGTGNANGFGAIQTGGLEASNVDISTEFANMITAQRAVEANSRIFDTANQIMKTLVYLGS